LKRQEPRAGQNADHDGYRQYEPTPLVDPTSTMLHYAVSAELTSAFYLDD
jgi:hypothetical protein